MTTPLVSILIPAYNAGEFIAETLRSALAQTWPNREIIVLDDGSSDNTLAVARRFESQGVIVETQPNQGAAATRNSLFDRSRGQYIQWLDADDLLSPDKIERQMAEAAHHGPDILLSCVWGSFCYRPERATFETTLLCHDLSPADWLYHKLSSNLHMQTGTWLTSRELLAAAGPWDPSMHVDDDGEYYCRVLLASKGVRFVPGARVYYRVTPASRLSYIGNSDRKMEAMAESMDRHIRALLSLEDSGRTRQACLTYLNNWLIHFHPERPDLVERLAGIARSLGGTLNPPKLRWKYDWIRHIAGWRAAKRAQQLLPLWKTTAKRRWDRFMHDRAHRSPTRAVPP